MTSRRDFVKALGFTGLAGSIKAAVAIASPILADQPVSHTFTGFVCNPPETATRDIPILIASTMNYLSRDGSGTFGRAGWLVESVRIANISTVLLDGGLRWEVVGARVIGRDGKAIVKPVEKASKPEPPRVFDENDEQYGWIAGLQNNNNI